STGSHHRQAGGRDSWSKRGREIGMSDTNPWDRLLASAESRTCLLRGLGRIGPRTLDPGGRTFRPETNADLAVASSQRRKPCKSAHQQLLPARPLHYVGCGLDTLPCRVSTERPVSL